MPKRKYTLSPESRSKLQASGRKGALLRHAKSTPEERAALGRWLLSQQKRFQDTAITEPTT